MNKLMRASMLALCAVGAVQAVWADEIGRVVSATPITQPVNVQKRVCVPQQVVVPQQKSGAGALMGAIAGGVIGNQVGKGSGNALATGIGLLGGAVLGDKIEGAPTPETRTVEQCSVENVVEYRTAGYTVTYEYAGKHYTTQMTNDPGPFLRLQIVPVGPANLSPVGATTAPVQVNR